MSVIFSIIGFVIFGFIIRALFADKMLADEPKNKKDWFFQLVISLIVGLVVWTVIPEKCKRSNDREYDGRYYE